MRSHISPIQEPNWQLLALQIKSAGDFGSLRSMSVYIGVPERVIYGLTQKSNAGTRMYWDNGERLRRCALDLLTAEQLERCGVPFA